MIQLPVYNRQGRQTGTFDVDEESLGGEVRYALLKQAYVRLHTNQRQGSARTKNRSRVEGSTRKLFRQKGTGNARMGTVRTNLRKGGGVAFAKLRTRENFRPDMPRKMRRLAGRNALLAKAVDQEIKVIEDFKFDKPRTADFAGLLEAVGVNRTCLVALDESNVNAVRSARNLEDVNVVPWQKLNAFNLLNHRFLVIDRECLKSFIDGKHRRSSAEATASGGAKRGSRGGA